MISTTDLCLIDFKTPVNFAMTKCQENRRYDENIARTLNSIVQGYIPIVEGEIVNFDSLYHEDLQK